MCGGIILGALDGGSILAEARRSISQLWRDEVVVINKTYEQVSAWQLPSLVLAI